MVKYLLIDACFSALGCRETLELVSRVKDMISNHEVKDQRPNDTDPDEHVVGVYTDVFPVLIDPAPDLHIVSRRVLKTYTEYLQLPDRTQVLGPGF